MNRRSKVVSLMLPFGLLLGICMTVELILWMIPGGTTIRSSFRFLFLGFGLVTIIHLYLIRLARYTKEQKLITGILLMGMMSHFVLSIALLVSYLFLLYQHRIFEVWLAMAFYILSFLVYISLSMRVK